MLCPRVTDVSLIVILGFCKDKLRSINLSRSKSFRHVGLSNLIRNCGNLVELDLSNANELRDSATEVIGEAKNLERLWLSRCRWITNVGIGCIATGCRKLRLLNLNWLTLVDNVGVGLVAVNCKELRSLDLSHVLKQDLSMICKMLLLLICVIHKLTSKKDQQQYWEDNEKPYMFITAREFAATFKLFHVGQRLMSELDIPFDKTKSHHPMTKRYGVSNTEILKACFSREVLLIRRAY
ncbi:hypothetical protein ACS0TY_013342 [Phlomoides rotata]